MSVKDLFVYTADTDALAVMRAVLSRPHALGIRDITFDVDRNPFKDSGMVRNGPELVRMKKGTYGKALILWDHHGSGWDSCFSPEKSQEEIRKRLDGVSWKDHSCAVVIVPELEEWLWHNEASIWGYLGISGDELTRWLDEYALLRKKTVDVVKKQEPKELLEHIFMNKARRTISLRDFEKIASKASLPDWQNSMSFMRVVNTLRD